MNHSSDNNFLTVIATVSMPKNCSDDQLMVLPIFLKVQGFHQARESFGRVQSYSGMIDCFKVIGKEEGATGFFKGLAPSTLKVSFLIP